MFPKSCATAILIGCVSVMASAAVCRAASVNIEMSSGEVVGGRWAGVAGAKVLLSDGATTRELPVDQIVALRPASPSQTTAFPPINAVLVDGTSIYAQAINMDDEFVTVEPRRQAKINVPITHVRSIRFRSGGPTTDPQWLGLTEKESRTDLMVIRRGNDQLDAIEGVIVGLDQQHLFFELDGDRIEAPLERLEGVLFRTTESATGNAPVKVTDIYGSTFLAARIEAGGASDSVEILLPGQVRHAIPIDQIKQITWASGRIMLSDQTPASMSVKLYLESKLPTDLVNDWFGPAADGVDLVAVATSSVEFRVEPGFQTLSGSVGRDSLVAAGGTVVIRVAVDDELKWEQSLVDSDPKGFQIPIGGARRVRLEVLAGDDGDVGDQVRFFKPRLLK